MSTRMIKANPTRDFFVNMLIRDILLKQAIIELIDNSIDGARSIREDNDFKDLKIDIKFDENDFCISDNCGGIPLHIAEEYAFRFGRPEENASVGKETTGIFGIGMKRALFKLGNYFEIESTALNSEFKVKLDVDEWKKGESNQWDFPFDEYKEGVVNDISNTGTVIKVTKLRSEVASELKSEEFEKELIEHVQRRVGLDIDNGIEITINDNLLTGHHVELVNCEEIQPIKEEFECGNVKVRIVAGITKKEGKNYIPENAGWYIYCNSRLVVAADKSSLTTWKDMENKNSGIVFNNMYASFQGSVFFSSDNPKELPWNTTKTGIDSSSAVYIQAKEKMKEVFKVVKGFIDEVNKTAKEDDGITETISKMSTIALTSHSATNEISVNRRMSINDIAVKTIPNVYIRYKKPKDEVEKIKAIIGAKNAMEVGEKTFEYYLDAEC